METRTVKFLSPFMDYPEIRVLTLEGLRDAIDKSIGSYKEKVADKAEDFRPTIAEKVENVSNDGKLHITIKRKKLKFNLNI